MRATKNIAEDIYAVEGFEVVFTSSDGSDVSNRRVDALDDTLRVIAQK